MYTDFDVATVAEKIIYLQDFDREFQYVQVGTQHAECREIMLSLGAQLGAIQPNMLIIVIHHLHMLYLASGYLSWRSRRLMTLLSAKYHLQDTILTRH